MSNVIQIKRGSGKPDGKLAPYELGFDTSSSTLYIGGELKDNKYGQTKGITVDRAKKLETPRTFQIDLGLNSAVSFDGSANIKPGITGTLPLSNGGTGATSAATAAAAIVGGQSITPMNISTTGGQYWTNGVYGLHLNNSCIVGINGLWFQDVVDSASEGIHFYRGSGTWDRLYALEGILYFAPNIATATHPGTRYSVFHSGSTIPIANGGTGATTAEGARTNLGAAAASHSHDYLPMDLSTVGSNNTKWAIQINTSPGAGIGGGQATTNNPARNWASGIKFQVYKSEELRYAAIEGYAATDWANQTGLRFTTKGIGDKTYQATFREGIFFSPKFATNAFDTSDPSGTGTVGQVYFKVVS